MKGGDKLHPVWDKCVTHRLRLTNVKKGSKEEQEGYDTVATTVVRQQHEGQGGNIVAVMPFRIDEGGVKG